MCNNTDCMCYDGEAYDRIRDLEQRLAETQKNLASMIDACLEEHSPDLSSECPICAALGRLPEIGFHQRDEGEEI